MKSLRAKILSQQGDFARAVEAWRELVDQAPEDSSSRQGLEVAERLLRRGRRSAFPRVGGAVAAILLLAAGFGFWVSYAWGHQAGAAVAMMQETVRDAQTERLQTARGLVQELHTMIHRGEQEDVEAARSLQIRLETLEQQVAEVGQTLETSESARSQATRQLATALESLSAQMQEDAARGSAANATVGERLDQIHERVAHVLAQVEDQPGQMQAAVERLAGAEGRSHQDGSAVAAIEDLRRDLAAALRLAKEVRVLSDRYERLVFRRGYVSEEEHRRMRQELGRLCDQSDVLLERVAALVWNR